MSIEAEFRLLWTAGTSPPDVFSFLKSRQPDDGQQWLAVLHVDQRFRWRTPHPFLVEDYLAALPNLPPGIDWRLQLAIGEFEARQDTDEQLNESEITTRFVDLSDSLRAVARRRKESSQAAPLGDSLPTANHGMPANCVTYITSSGIGVQEKGRYRLDRVLGEGAFGRVYLGYDEELHRQVAIKVPAKGRFQRAEDAIVYLAEARTVAGLDHPHIVPVYDMGRTRDGSVYLVSRYIDGTTLDKVIKGNRPNQRDAAALIAMVARALQHAHEKRLIHRDVKPANILIDGVTGFPFVTDFGLAIREEDYLKETELAGTPAYMSPEQARGEGHRLDNRSDVYSLGVVLYELLTSKKPFVGSSTRETLYLVISQEPRRPRELVNNVSSELERICLKALSKRASDRYGSAAAMAQDLEEWLKPKTEAKPQKPVVPITPRGLRSFTSDDADFFLELLPGPHNREGLPESIAFWKVRIEQRDPDQTFSVGLLYGPSGCGKSSLVKAGLIPQLSADVIPVYIEATADDTESRLLRRLRKRIPELPSSLGLAETLEFVRRSPGPKVVLIIDQFEQWLYSHRVESDGELCSGLRQCDGGRLQAILMIRDDFYLAAARLMNQIDVPILTDQNFKLVDLFDLEHARRVLIRLGYAYGKFPSDQSALSTDQMLFVRRVVDGLAEAGKVVSVRLALLVDMLKAREWEPATLQSIGGLDGIGISFLEETFVSSRADARHRTHQTAVRKVLRRLLPDLGSDIKGAMCSEEALLEASGYANRLADFQELLRILDGELRLLTPTDPEGHDSQSGSDAGQRRHYQLTHDYLVSSLREWLSRKQRETRKGRVELKLAEQSTLWSAKPENRYLPSLLEWFSIWTLTNKRTWSTTQAKMMAKAAWVHGTRALIILAILTALVLGGLTIRNDAMATRLVEGLLQAETSQVGTVVNNLATFHNYVRDDLQRAYAQHPEESNAKLHAAMAMVAYDKTAFAFLKDRLLTVNSMQFQSVCDMLIPHKSQLLDEYWKIAFDRESPALRFQAACALATFDPENQHWENSELHTFLADYLVGVQPSDLLPWRNALRPVKHHLTNRLTYIYRDDQSDAQARSFATETLADYVGEDPEVLFDLLASANEKQFGIVFAKLTKHTAQAIAFGRAEVTRPIADDEIESIKQTRALRQANAAVLLLRMQTADDVWPLLKHSTDPRVRSYIIHWLSPRGGDAEAIIARYDQETDVSVKRALLLCLGEFSLEDAQKQILIEKLLHVYRTHPDAGLHAASEWLLRQWKTNDRLLAIDFELKQDEQKRAAVKDQAAQWYVNTQGQTLVIVDAGEFQMGSPTAELGSVTDETLHRRRIGRRLAIANKEVTQLQWKAFRKANPKAGQTNSVRPRASAQSDDSPATAITWYEAAWYCNWLSEQEGIDQAQWCYEPNENGMYGPGMKAKENFWELTGYRLPTEAEWEFACRAGTTTSRYFGAADDLLPHYAWYLLNSDRQTHAVASLKPNDFGLFDMQGNVYEWCYDNYYSYPKSEDAILSDRPVVKAIDDAGRPIVRGGAFFHLADEVRSAFRRFHQPANPYNNSGLRPVRTIAKP